MEVAGDRAGTKMDKGRMAGKGGRVKPRIKTEANESRQDGGKGRERRREMEKGGKSGAWDNGWLAGGWEGGRRRAGGRSKSRDSPSSHTSSLPAGSILSSLRCEN